jgi:hypothetical protein
MNKEMKNKAAVALGKRGGKARGKTLSPERRSEIARMADWHGLKVFLLKSTPSKSPARFRDAR